MFINLFKFLFFLIIDIKKLFFGKTNSKTLLLEHYKVDIYETKLPLVKNSDIKNKSRSTQPQLQSCQVLIPTLPTRISMKLDASETKYERGFARCESEINMGYTSVNFVKIFQSRTS